MVVAFLYQRHVQHWKFCWQWFTATVDLGSVWAIVIKRSIVKLSRLKCMWSQNWTTPWRETKPVFDAEMWSDLQRFYRDTGQSRRLPLNSYILWRWLVKLVLNGAQNVLLSHFFSENHRNRWTKPGVPKPLPVGKICPTKKLLVVYLPLW